VVRSNTSGKFVTFFVAFVDHENGRLDYVNAGHNYPRLRRADGTLEPLTAGGLPLGMIEGTAYEAASVAFGKGDALLLFSDGISEAIDSFTNEYGEERLDELWRTSPMEAPAQTIERVMADVIAFRGAAAQNDDMTTVVLAPRG
jgi:sigma-B regulation protein RsbU (phosphoserine phosphatase)